MRTGDELTFVTPPRFEPDAAFKYQIRLGSDRATAMQEAVQGQRGYGDTVDYRGRVVAVWSYLPSYRWGMVVKQDIDEAFALINQQRLVAGAARRRHVLIVTSVALWLSQRITRPIREAAIVTGQVASGDLAVSCESRPPARRVYCFRPSAR